MNDSSTDKHSAQAGNNDDKSSANKRGPSDFVTGLVTFIIFLFFMTGWMYFSG